MDTILHQLVVEMIIFLPVALAFIWLRYKLRSIGQKAKLPFEELRRRPAGESLRLKLQELDEKILDYLMLLVGVPFVLAMWGSNVRPSAILAVTAFLLSSVWVGFVIKKFSYLIQQRLKHRLGFEGERFVGEELTSLTAAGFQIFHDVPFKNFNIDHVLVGPGGVFSVETKARRKPLNKSGVKQYRVEFKADRLEWPWGAETRDLDQAAENARTLSKFLTSSVGEPVYVRAILTMPGWLIERRTPCANVHVLNPREIHSFCNSKEHKLGEIMIKRITHQMEEKCKIQI